MQSTPRRTLPGVLHGLNHLQHFANCDAMARDMVGPVRLDDQVDLHAVTRT